MSCEDCDEALAVGWLQQVRHLMHDDVFEQILRLLHELRVEADMTRTVIAASPLGLHPLEKIPGDSHLQLRLPLSDH